MSNNNNDGGITTKVTDGNVEITFPIECKGRNSNKHECLEESIKVVFRLTKRSGSNLISSDVKCKYNTGGHGQRCKASHPNTDKEGKGIICPYSVDLPYAIDVAEY